MNGKKTQPPSVTISLGWLVAIIRAIDKVFEFTGGRLADWFGQSMTNEDKARVYVKDTTVLLSKTTAKDLSKGSNSKKAFLGGQEGVRLNAWRLIWMPIAYLFNIGKYNEKGDK